MLIVLSESDIHSKHANAKWLQLSLLVWISCDKADLTRIYRALSLLVEVIERAMGLWSRRLTMDLARSIA